MSRGHSDKRTLAKCDDCGHFTVAIVEDGLLRPVDNKPGMRCPVCGGTALSAHTLQERDTRTTEPS